MSKRKVFYLSILLVLLSLPVLYWGVTIDSPFLILAGFGILIGGSAVRMWWRWRVVSDK